MGVSIEIYNVQFNNKDGRQAASDEDLMLQLSNGNLEALGFLYNRYGRMVRSAIARLAPNVSAHQLEDLTQETFLALVDSAPRYQEQARFKSWLYSIAVRRTKEWRRVNFLHQAIRSKHKEQCAGISLRKTDSPEASTAIKDEVEKVLSQLPAGQREVLWLFEAEGFSGEEVAKMLGVSPETVFTRLHRARKQLSKKLSREDFTSDFIRGSK